MQDFLQYIPDVYVKVSADFVETLIQTRRSELFTGAIRLHFPPDESLLLTFLDGTQQRLYRHQNGQTEVVPQKSWSDVVNRPDASAAFIKLSEDALRFIRVANESPVRKEEKLTCTKQELATHVSNWVTDSSPSILHLQNGKTDKLYLIAGNSAPIVEELSLMDDGAHYSIYDASFPNYLSSLELDATRYVSDGSHDIWQEHELRFAFHLLMRFLLIRFSELAGRILAERLGDQLSEYVTDGRMRIKISINGVANHHYFNSMEDEIRVYLVILRRFREEAGTAIGMRMAEDLVRDILLKLNTRQQELLKQHIYEKYLLDRTPGVGWR